MNKPHKWAKEIKAWADGALIESRDQFRDRTWSSWCPAPHPAWVCGLTTEYRIKPEPRVWWFLENEGGDLLFTSSEESANDALTRYPHTWKKIHKYVEPLE